MKIEKPELFPKIARWITWSNQTHLSQYQLHHFLNLENLCWSRHYMIETTMVSCQLKLNEASPTFCTLFCSFSKILSRSEVFYTETFLLKQLTCTMQLSQYRHIKRLPPWWIQPNKPYFIKYPSDNIELYSIYVKRLI